MAEDKILVEGIRCFPKHANAPDFVLASVVITPNKLVSWLKENESLLTEYNGDKQIRLQMLRSKDGKPYMSVDTYKKQDGYTAKPSSSQDDSSSDLPF